MNGDFLAVIDILKNRRSTRQYLEAPVEKEKLAQILEAARLSPSANNNQPWSFVVITQQDVKDKLLTAYPRKWFLTAPVIIVACANPEAAWSRQDGEQTWKVDVAIAVQSMNLVANELGLGTCYLAAFDEQKLKDTLGIPKEMRAIVMLTVGYPAEEKGPVIERKPLEEIIHYEHW
jgi:nitroreductase